jgi:3-hydroxyanthranilate 3,4-dioxygenase
MLFVVGPIDLQAFIEQHAEQLKPPVGNARLFEDGDFIVMIVGGPNRRRDFHVDPGDELFYQLQGDIVLRVVDDGDGQIREVAIRQGEMFVLPGGVPHSPQRGEATIGLVIERRRKPGEVDELRWYCDACGAVVHAVRMELVDITTQLKDAIEAWETDARLRTCGTCGAVAPAGS